MTFSVEGEFTTAKVFAEETQISDAAMSQLYALVNHPACTEPIRVMPDVHPSGEVLVGFSMPLTSEVIPKLVGGDIGCGMTAWTIEEGLPYTREKRDTLVRDAAPGRGDYSTTIDFRAEFPCDEAMATLRQFRTTYSNTFNERLNPPFPFDTYDDAYIDDLFERIEATESSISRDAGTLGGGNHFVEFGRSQQTGEYWLVIHSGSRRLGKAVAKYWTEQADGHHSLGWLTDEEAHGYFIDMVFCQTFALWNRRLMGEAICEALEVQATRAFEAIHNYIDFDDLVIRKGATRSYEGERLVIPIDAESGTLVCKGTSNPEANFSAPHGAGRVLSRSDAKELITPEEFETAVGDSYVPDADASIVSEAPQAYKEAEYLLDNLDGLAEPVDLLDPVHNVKHR